MVRPPPRRSAALRPATCASSLARAWPLALSAALSVLLVASYRLAAGGGRAPASQGTATSVLARPVVGAEGEGSGGARRFEGSGVRVDARTALEKDGLGTGDSLAAPRRGGRHGRLHGGLGRQPGEGAPRVGNSDLDSGGKVRRTTYSDWMETEYASEARAFDVGELLPRMLPLEEKHKAWASREPGRNASFYRLLRPVDVAPLVAKLRRAEGRPPEGGAPASEPPRVWTYDGQEGQAFIDGREDNMKQFKPGVYDMKFVFSSNNAKHTVRTPYWREWEDVLRPIIEAVLGRGACERLIRAQLAYMTPGAKILHHRDTGNWVKAAHRVHVPLEVNDRTRFQVKLHEDDDEWVQIPLEEGRAFEINNNFMHRVFNDGELHRTHLLIDLGEQDDRTYIDLQPGEHCEYAKLNKFGVCH